MELRVGATMPKLVPFGSGSNYMNFTPFVLPTIYSVNSDRTPFGLRLLRFEVRVGGDRLKLTEQRLNLNKPK